MTYGGISVSDLNDDGSYEILFTGYDDYLHVWDPVLGQELPGWPIDLGTIHYQSLLLLI